MIKILRENDQYTEVNKDFPICPFVFEVDGDVSETGYPGIPRYYSTPEDAAEGMKKFIMKYRDGDEDFLEELESSSPSKIAKLSSTEGAHYNSYRNTWIYQFPDFKDNEIEEIADIISLEIKPMYPNKLHSTSSINKYILNRINTIYPYLASSYKDTELTTLVNSITEKVVDKLSEYLSNSTNVLYTVVFGYYKPKTFYLRTFYDLNNVNIGLKQTRGMQAGEQIGFTRELAQSFINKFIEHYPEYEDENYYLSEMRVSTLNKYKWTKVSTIFGDCYVTDTGIRMRKR